MRESNDLTVKLRTCFLERACQTKGLLPAWLITPATLNLQGVTYDASCNQKVSNIPWYKTVSCERVERQNLSCNEYFELEQRCY